MTISSVLTHRCTVMRSIEDFSDGSPAFTWSVVSVRTPVLLRPTPSTTDPTWTSSQRHEADSEAILFSLATADLHPGDRVTLTRPPTGQTFEVQADPSTVLTLHTASHREWHVRQVS